MSLSLHPIIDAILDHHGETLTSTEIAHILGVAPTTISEGLRKGRIEGLSQNLRGGGALQRYQVTKAAIISYIWHTTTGDRTTLRAALSERAPKLLKSLEAPPPSPKAKPTVKDPYSNHPDLFSNA
ncbi:MAG: hypothetical protein E6R03_02070 [Hyphomicrobiaceae bacterium]|nr:MAG: hypothetical protein E6R03_02070 [Hyphomicrobiaceae bacterium]